MIQQTDVMAQLFASGSDVNTGSSVLDALLPYLNLGIVAILVLMFVTKTGIVPKWTLDEADRRHHQESGDDEQVHRREIADKEAAHARELAGKDSQIVALQNDKDELKRTNEQLTRVAQEQFLPALIEANRLTALYVDTIARRQQRSPGGSGPT